MEKNDVTCPGVEGRFLVFAVFFMRRSINSPFADWVYTLILNIIIKNYNCHIYKSFNYNIITFSFAFDGILLIFLFLSASFICLILYFH